MAARPADDPDDSQDLVCEGRTCYFGCDLVRYSTLDELLRCTAVSISWGEIGRYCAFQINDTGRAISRRPELADEVARMLASGGGAFTIKNDALVRLAS